MSLVSTWLSSLVDDKLSVYCIMNFSGFVCCKTTITSTTAVCCSLQILIYPDVTAGYLPILNISFITMSK